MPRSEFDAKIERLADFQVVQGALLDRLENVVAGNSDAIAHLSESMHEMRDNMRVMQDNMQVMQDAMRALFERMDRFIRGLEGNGHRPGKGRGKS